MECCFDLNVFDWWIDGVWWLNVLVWHSCNIGNCKWFQNAYECLFCWFKFTLMIIMLNLWIDSIGMLNDWKCYESMIEWLTDWLIEMNVRFFCESNCEMNDRMGRTRPNFCMNDDYWARPGVIVRQAGIGPCCTTWSLATQWMTVYHDITTNEWSPWWK